MTEVEKMYISLRNDYNTAISEAGQQRYRADILEKENAELKAEIEKLKALYIRSDCDIIKARLDDIGTMIEELRFNPYHDKLGRFTSKSGISLDKSAESGIIKLEDIEIGKSLSAKAKNYNIVDPATGEIFKFVEGTKIQNAQAFAGYGCKKPLSPAVADGLSQQIGGSPDKWQHCKGNGVIDYHGEERKAEVHWFQENTVGKHKFKIKEWLE